MNAINSMDLPHFADGGSDSAFGAKSAGNSVSLNLSFNGKKLGKVSGSRESVRNITNALQELSRGTA
jgi:hypothetical protein